MKNKTIKIFCVGALIILLVPFKVLAINDVQIDGDVNHELLTADTAVLTTIVALNGRQATSFDVESNHIDITLDNASAVTFDTAVGGQYFRITKQSGSNDYTVSPSCPTTVAVLSGTGPQVVLRLEVITTSSCPNPGGGPAYSPPPDTTPPTNASISINNGANATSSTNVNLTLGATDASQMKISNSIDFVGSNWETFNTVKSWTLTVGDGLKTVYARFKDLVGNISGIVSDSIELAGIVSSPETTPTQPSTQDASGTYDYEWVRQSDYPTNLIPGQVVQVWVEVKNTGTATWHSTGPNAVKLGSGSNWFGNDGQKQDYTSEVYDSASWLGPNRASSFAPGVGPDLPPGYNTRFTFNVKAPATPGTYKAYFTPVAEYITWMKDIGMYWGVNVGGTSSQPQQSPSTTKQYTVRAGDNLSSIAENVYGDSSQYTRLIDLNKSRYPTLEDNPSLVMAGWVLDY